MLFKYLFVLLFFTVFSFAGIENSSAKYDISYGLFGKLGEAKANIQIKNSKYTIKVQAYATGFSKHLSGNLHETYLSEGNYKHNLFQPTFFKKVTSQNDILKTEIYKFDYKNKKIKHIYIKTYKVYEDLNSLLDIDETTSFTWKKKEISTTLDYWAKEDILSLFFNLKHHIQDFSKEYKKSILTVGAGKSRNGRVDIEIPNKSNKKDLIETLKQEKDILIVKIYKDIFTSQKGELYISLNDEGLCNQAVLKDVVLFGDIIGKLQ